MVQPVVTSGESDCQGADNVEDNTDGSSSSSSDDDDDDDDDRSLKYGISGTSQRLHHHNEQEEEHHGGQPAEADLYDANADEEDAAYVEKHLRGSTAVQHARRKHETAATSSSPSLQSSITTAATAAKQKIKAPNSDAVLSCPCCFLTVCMDCQQHERYPNQYRAMFVMNIMVRWDLTLVYDRGLGRLVPNVQEPHHQLPLLENNNNNVVLPDPEETATTAKSVPSQQSEKKELYYTVCCANCHTQVASLDMTDEVYHFYGCLAS